MSGRVFGIRAAAFAVAVVVASTLASQVVDAQWGGGGGGRERVTCQSQKDREQFCPASIGGDVRVIRNISDTRCVEGRNWRWSRDGVRVWSGCRAEFEYRAP